MTESLTTTLRALLDNSAHPIPIEAMEALLDLDARGALTPHGLGGLGRACLASAVQQLKELTQVGEIDTTPPSHRYVPSPRWSMEFCAECGAMKEHPAHDPN